MELNIFTPKSSTSSLTSGVTKTSNANIVSYYFFFSSITLAFITSILFTWPMRVPLTGILTHGVSKNFSNASKEPGVDACT